MAGSAASAVEAAQRGCLRRGAAVQF